MNSIQQVVFDHLPRQKRSPSGWYSFNAVCCPHNGEGIDKRSRGGVITEGEGISYHCFNCGFTASFTPGRPVSYKASFRCRHFSCFSGKEFFIRNNKVNKASA